MNNVHGIKVTGGTFPAQIWAAFMKAALAKLPKEDFKKPTGLATAQICLDSGGLATPSCPKKGSGLFLDKQLPKECPLHGTPTAITVPNVTGMPKQDAIAALEARLLKYAIQEKDSTSVAPGTVFDQDPKAGSVGTTQTVVTLVVSSGSAADKQPVALFDYTPKPPSSSGAIKFDASASTDDGTIVKYVWEFGDGVKDTASGKIASHKYAAPGKYSVILWVTDNAGHVSKKEEQLTVN
jgi:hypothetical protein